MSARPWLSIGALLLVTAAVDAGQRQGSCCDGSKQPQQLTYNCRNNENECESIRSFIWIKSFFRTYLEDYGIEVYPFKLGWYYEYVDLLQKDFHKPDYSNDTIGFITITTPDYFKKTIKPYVCDYAKKHGIDAVETIEEPWTDSMNHLVSQIREGLSAMRLDHIGPGEKLNSTGKYFGVREAGQVSGGVRYYRRQDVVPDPWPKNKAVHGVSIHPKYGGWFAFASAVILPDLQYPGLMRIEPEDSVQTNDLRTELLEKANENSETWRDINEPDKAYCDEQVKFDYEASREEKVAMMREWARGGH